MRVQDAAHGQSALGADDDQDLRLDVAGAQGPTETIERLVGRRLREQRLSRDLSQTQLVSRLRERGLDWHQTTVAKTELGLRPLRLNEVASLAAALEVSLDQLLQAQPRPPLTVQQQALAEQRLVYDRLVRDLIDATLARDTANARYEAVEKLLKDCKQEIHRLEAEESASG